MESLPPTQVLSKNTTTTSNSAPDSPTISMNSNARPKNGGLMTHQKFDERKKGVQSSVKLRHRGISKYLGATHSKDNLLDTGMSAIFGASLGTHSHWVDSNQAKSLFCGAIVLNAIFIGVDASIAPTESEGDWNATSIILFVFEIAFLLLFMLEVMLRLHAEKWAFFRDSWNLFDSVILIVTIADISVSIAENFSTLKDSAKDNFTHIAKVFRIARVLRLLRLFRFVQELNLILSGMGGSLLKLFWCLSLLFITVYMAAIFALRFIGQAEHLQGNERISEYFGTLGRCMFTLFTFVTLEGFPDTTMYLMRTDILGPPVAIAVVAFIIFTNLAVLNLVAAVVLESIMVAAENDQHKRQARLERERVQAVQRLAKVFTSIHPDHHAGLMLKDFRHAVQEHPELKAELSRLDVLSQDVDELFHLMDCDGDGVLSVHEFIEGLLRMQSGVASAKHVMSLQYDLQHMWNTLGQGQDALAEGQLFLRNDLRSGQRQLARRLEAKMEKLFQDPNRRMPARAGSCDEAELETPTAAPMLQRQNNQNLNGWQWRKGDKGNLTPAGSDAPTVSGLQGADAELKGLADKSVEQLEARLTDAVHRSVMEASEAMERRLLRALEGSQRSNPDNEDNPHGQEKTIGEVLTALESLPGRLQEELVPALRGTASPAFSPPHKPPESRSSSQPCLDPQRFDSGQQGAEKARGSSRPPHYSIQALRPTPLDSAAEPISAGSTTGRPTGGFSQRNFVDAAAESISYAVSCEVSPNPSPSSHAHGDGRSMARSMPPESLKDAQEKMAGGLEGLPSRGRSCGRRLSTLTGLSENIDIGPTSSAARADVALSPWNGARSESAAQALALQAEAQQQQQQQAASQAAALHYASFAPIGRGSESSLLDPRPAEAWGHTTHIPGTDSLLWTTADGHAAGWPHASAWQVASGMPGPPPPCRCDLWPRLLNVKRWAVDRGLASMPFDKLVMRLDALGIQLSIPEQDALKQLMQGPPADSTSLHMTLP
eukprot:CAMPEP_0178370384 /NCGR_PEP_ID=MMETSP0689_2-20121128/274_1 /TAXON_ID=160604 /ORGANISM="Amphidinium massartii, Strain CS-259" /LENGTH=998 /DNA_ID=CAMNT_0019990203 /DNA_START=69 /DNA_END=3065 /DNA_ORIENTATION=-